MLLCLSACMEDTGSMENAAEAAPKNPPMEIRGFSASVSLEGVPQYEVQSERALLLEKSSIVEMENIQVSFVQDKDDGNTGSLQADTGLFHYRDNPGRKRSKNDIDLEGQVVFETSDGTFLRTPELHYSARDEKVYSESGFEKRKETRDQVIIVTGKSFVTDRNLENWEDVGAKLVMKSKANSR